MATSAACPFPAGCRGGLVRRSGVVLGLLPVLVEMLVVGGCRGGGPGLCGRHRLYDERRPRGLYCSLGHAGDEVVAGALLLASGWVAAQVVVRSWDPNEGVGEEMFVDAGFLLPAPCCWNGLKSDIPMS
ncbi:hypothetical protein TRIUR3_00238 [Triticum urartu]|uniref:Uncharacterized protein n=1 Tax=Triticum urartu TaxID=4572 RepID=M7ZKJ4_TRIUA|nr:hypothetical protein TRIUR3_00238 [Triticum urartu]